MYRVHTFNLNHVPENIHLIPVFTTYVLGTYWYILEVKSMYRVHDTGLCLFISAPYYSMVHTGTHRYELGTYNRSGFQKFKYGYRSFVLRNRSSSISKFSLIFFRVRLVLRRVAESECRLQSSTEVAKHRLQCRKFIATEFLAQDLKQYPVRSA